MLFGLMSVTCISHYSCNWREGISRPTSMDDVLIMQRREASEGVLENALDDWELGIFLGKTQEMVVEVLVNEDGRI